MMLNEIVKLGSYFQSDAETKEPIEWVVIEKTDTCATLISKSILSEKEFNKEYVRRWTWKNSSLRQWLNTEFLDSAFSDEEKQTMLPDEDGFFVFILSCEEASTLMTMEQRAAVMTPFALSGSAYRFSGSVDNCWWVCSRGYSSSDTIIVKPDGYLNGDAYDRFSTGKCGVRPCIRIKTS